MTPQGLQHPPSDVPHTMTVADALTLFASLPPVSVSEMIGHWQGRGIATGHSLDQLLETSGWVGKRFDSAEAVHPLVHKTVIGEMSLNPGVLPFVVMERLGIGTWPIAKLVFSCVTPFFGTRKPRARLRLVDHDGVTSAAMIYDQIAVIDHFRRIDDARLMGMMDRRGDAAPLFFLLTKMRR